MRTKKHLDVSISLKGLLKANYFYITKRFVLCLPKYLEKAIKFYLFYYTTYDTALFPVV